MAVERYYNEDKTMIGVLVSPGYGAGWSTWYDCDDGNGQTIFDIAIDKRIIEWWKEHPIPYYLRLSDTVPYRREYHGLDVKEQYEEFHNCLRDFLESIGYTDVYLGGYEEIELQWVEVGKKFYIHEDDGSEDIIFLDEIQYCVA